jgi:uncharacterized surface protein with fasciclin (FAS1) repeats
VDSLRRTYARRCRLIRKLIAPGLAGVVAVCFACGCAPRRAASPAARPATKAAQQKRRRGPEGEPPRRRARPAPKPARDVFDTLKEGRSFGTLVKALETAGLDKELRGPGPFTLLAPSEEAFAKLPAGELDRLLKPESKEKLRAILSYHVLPGKVAAEDLADMKSVPTIDGRKLQIRMKEGMIVVDGAMVVEVNIEATNGMIHVIDGVLRP